MFKKLLNSVIICLFLADCFRPMPVHAQGIADLPKPGSMVELSPAYVPLLIKGLKVHPDNPLAFDFIVDTGDDKTLHIPDMANEGKQSQQEQLKAKANLLIKYFFAALTVPEKDIWVNLSPYEKNRVAPEALGQTEMGRDMLAQDYILKQLTASLIYPEKGLGKDFWERIYKEAQARFGTTQVPVNTFNKVWIVADKASIYEHNDTVLITGGHMKVMLEEDYAAFSYSVIAREAKQLLGNIVASPTTLRNDTNALGSQIVREIVLPALEKEINEGKNFAPLRQIFYTLILAKWYKTNLKEALLNKVYADKSKVSGVDAKDKTEKDKIYQQYVEAYKKGVFNYIKEELPTVIPEGESRQEIVPRKYFSGGMQPSPAQLTLSSASEAMQAGASRGRWATVSVNANPVQLLKLKENTAAAMTTTSASVVQEGIDALVNVYRPEGPNQPFDVDELYNNLLVATINKFNANRLAMLMRTSFKVAPTFTSMILDLMLEKGLLYKIELPNVGEKIFFHYTPDELRSADAVLAAFTKGLTDMGIPTNSEDVGKAYEHAFSGSFNMKGFLAKFPDDTRIKVLADNVLYGPWVKQYDFDAAVERAASKEVRSFQPTVNDIDTAAVNEERLASFIRVGLFSDTRPALIGGLETLQRGDNIAGFEILAHQEFETQRHGLVINKIFRVVPDNGQPENFNAIEVDTLGSPLDTEGVVIIKYKAGDAVNVVYFTPGDSDEAMITTKTLANPGGIDLNTDDMAMVVSKDGVGVQMKSDSALFAKFRRGDFSGILPVIVLITPLMSILPLLGLN